MTSQRRWEELLNSMDEVVTNKCQAEHQLTANKLLSIQEMVVYIVFRTNTVQHFDHFILNLLLHFTLLFYYYFSVIRYVIL